MWLSYKDFCFCTSWRGGFYYRSCYQHYYYLSQLVSDISFNQTLWVVEVRSGNLIDLALGSDIDGLTDRELMVYDYEAMSDEEDGIKLYDKRDKKAQWVWHIHSAASISGCSLMSKSALPRVEIPKVDNVAPPKLGNKKKNRNGSSKRNQRQGNSRSEPWKGLFSLFAKSNGKDNSKQPNASQGTPKEIRSPEPSNANWMVAWPTKNPTRCPLNQLLHLKPRHLVTIVQPTLILATETRLINPWNS